jgi:plastocyanin
MNKLLALLLACLAIGLVACGGDDDESGGGGEAGGAPTAEETEGDGGAGGGEAGGGGDAEVSMENIQFDPNDVTVSAGDTITFVNNESVPHDVHKSSGPGEDFASGPSGGMQEGDTFELTLDVAGSYEYVCNVHAPGMSGTIKVE